MSDFLAPNGEKSNLTPEQYKLVRTTAFKEWFGDWENSPETASKVVDENGEPLVVWRGESKDFNVFEYKKLGSSLKTAWRNAGFYFSPTKSGAEQYMFFMGSRILKQFFLNIKNPYTLDSQEFFGVMDWGSLPTQKFKTNKSATDFAIKRISEIKSENYDGAFVTVLENNDVVEIIAFEPNQIKLADGTNTTLDSNNPDIRFEEGGKVDLSEYNRALKEVYPLIPQISHKIIHENNLPHNKETIIKLNEEIIEKVKRGDDKTLDLMWDIAGSLSLKHSINVITYYHKKYKNGGLTKKIKFHIEDDEEGRITISINGVGEVILAETFPEYEFLEDVGEDGLEELNVEEGDMIGKIEHLEIEDEYKRQGYAKLLMEKAIEVAKQKGLMPLYLNASPMGSKRYGLNIEDLTGFYESLGFEVFLRQGGNNLMILKDTYKTGGEAKNNNMEKQIKIQFADNNYANGGVTYSEWSKDDFWQEQFNDWKKDGNVSKNTDGTYSTQDAQYTNSLRGIIGLKKYFYNEFVKGQYAGGGKAVKKYVVVGEVYDGGEVWKETFDNLDEALDLAREIENGWTDDGTYYLITI